MTDLHELGISNFQAEERRTADFVFFSTHYTHVLSKALLGVHYDISMTFQSKAMKWGFCEFETKFDFVVVVLYAFM